MLKTSLSTAIMVSAFALMAPSAQAMEVIPAQAPAVDTKEALKASNRLHVSMDNAQTSQSCAIQLTGEAADIYSAVSPKVVKDTNLRKLVEKQVIFKVLRRKLTVEQARQYGEAAGACLSLLKTEAA